MTSAAHTNTIDTDVHCAAPDISALAPYLAEQWLAYANEVSFRRSLAVDHCYPAWSKLAGGAADVHELRANVLNRSSLAVLSCYAGLDSIRHPHFSAALASATNDWLRGEWLDKDERLVASIVVTPQHPELAAAEIERVAADRRFVQVLLPARTWDPYGTARYAPMWEAAARHGLALGIHYGGLAGGPPSAAGWLETYTDDYVNAVALFETQLTSLIMEGVLDRHPNLRVAVLESGWTWLPSLMWKMDKEWKSQRREVPWVKELPSLYTRRHVRASIQPTDAPPTAAQTAEIIGQIGSDDVLMYASDYPHDHACDPEQVFASLPPEQAERVRWRNAAECYRLDERVPARSAAS